MLCSLHPAAHAQQANVASLPVENLPNAPEERPLRADGPGPADTQRSAGISGTVVDANGGTLGDAELTLTCLHPSAEFSSALGNHGEFSFHGLAAGTYNLKIKAPGMETLVLENLALQANEVRALPRISMAIAGTTTEVQVSVTKTELALEQIKAAEHQRVLGILPNFYSSYIWDAAPLNPGQKFDLALHSIADPVEFLGTGIVAAAEQVNNTLPGYGKGGEGYAKRYGAAYADEVIGRLLGSAVLPSLLHQDPRYFYKGTGSVRSRATYAVTRALVTRGDNGQSQPNYSRVLGSFAAGGLANLYYPRSDRGLGLTLGDGFVNIAGHAVDNLLQEFLLRRLTPNVPDFERGKP